MLIEKNFGKIQGLSELFGETHGAWGGGGGVGGGFQYLKGSL